MLKQIFSGVVLSLMSWALQTASSPGEEKMGCHEEEEGLKKA